ncbi:HET domain-containing protein [Fusarium keratoplasticum]|uniref:HET domain-containing protein n=1 Tax=Fusarium keratoplasticum TaxID=1328300 RepID=A0ACC0QDA3_9HYPO|nr:HET domain-containing protein [Fusarium keratoplasticum]KAI8650863.1 HET domain-containing protein [Fusarium keratoplasticum]
MEGFSDTSKQISHDHEICIAADPDSPAYQSGLIGGRYLGMDMKAPEYISAIGKWVQGCISSHERCCKAISDDSTFNPYLVELPTRCIEVTFTGAYLRHTLGTTGSYITLSHRWTGETETVKTTSSNYQERISGADLGPLSKNFDDAIAIARRLGVRYIWIGSICIIQESEDWDQEKWKMGQYYEHALFTISAVGTGHEQKEGSSFLDPSQARTPNSLVRLPFRQDGVRKGSVYLYRRDLNAYLLFHNDVDKSELHSRGWVFQERLLSKRIIYFTHRESFLECSSQVPQSFCNDVVKPPLPKLEQAIQLGTFRDIPMVPRHGFKVNFTLEHDSPLDIWYTIATSFSATSLTNQHDHLAAISGAAFEYGQAIENQLGNRKGNKKGKETRTTPNYLSGLWLRDIHHGLMWLREGAPNLACLCGAPSWSWLSY